MSTTTTDLAKLEAELRAHVHKAKRCMPKVGTPKHPTPWDREHADINLLLTRWQWEQDHPTPGSHHTP